VYWIPWLGKCNIPVPGSCDQWKDISCCIKGGQWTKNGLLTWSSVVHVSKFARMHFGAVHVDLRRSAQAGTMQSAGVSPPRLRPDLLSFLFPHRLLQTDTRWGRCVTSTG
jgi:hypothetical protein